jgi:flagellar hook assembly protein FlgD
VVFGGTGEFADNDVWALAWGEPVGVGEHGALPDRLTLAPPRPNPSRGRVSFDFEVPRAARVRIEVFDLRGRRVKTVEDALLSPGRYARTWEGSDEAGGPAPGGVYFIQLWSPERILRQKAVLIR